MGSTASGWERTGRGGGGQNGQKSSINRAQRHTREHLSLCFNNHCLSTFKTNVHYKMKIHGFKKIIIAVINWKGFRQTVSKIIQFLKKSI